MRSVLRALLVAAVMGTAAAAEEPVLHVLTSTDLSPMARGADMDLPGFHHELITAMAERAGLRLELEYLPWERAQRLAAPGTDLYLLAVTRTARREPLYDWVTPILDVSQVLLTTGPRLDSFEDARGVGQVAGRSIYHDRLIAEGFADAVMADDPNSLRMLSLGRVAAVFTLRERAVFSWAELGLPPERLVVGEPIERAKLWLVRPKGGDPERAERLRAALASLKADGTYRTLRARYFGEDEAAPSAPGG